MTATEMEVMRIPPSMETSKFFFAQAVEIQKVAATWFTRISRPLAASGWYKLMNTAASTPVFRCCNLLLVGRPVAEDPGSGFLANPFARFLVEVPGQWRLL